MENKIGMFGQNKYVLKGLFRPKFFNRLSGQGKGKVVGYILLITLISTVLFWGIKVLLINMPNGLIHQTELAVKNLPEFTYENYVLDMGEEYEKSNIDRTRFVIVDSSVESASSEYKEAMCIRTDWSIGKIVLIFNSKSLTVILPLGNGSGPTIDYQKLQNVLRFASKLNNSTIVTESEITIYKAVGVLAIASFVVFAITAVISGLIAFAIGFLITKIFKLQYSYSELVKIGMYVAGVTNLIKVLLNAQPLEIPFIWINVIFVLATAAYMFFALTGSQEDVGPSSTIVFTKPTSKKLSGEIEPEDPFARKDRYRDERYKKETRASEAEAAPVPVVPVVPVTPVAPSSSAVKEVEVPLFRKKGEPAPVVETPQPVYEEPVVEYSEPAPVYEEPAVTYSEPAPVYEEPAYTYSEPAPVYEEPVVTYSEPAPVYEEPAYTYSEPAPVYEEPAPAVIKEESPRPMIIKSEATFGVGYSTSTGKKSKPKYDRPITAPDSYNGSYYGSSDEEGYSNAYGSATLLNRGSLYGKTLGAPSGSVESNPFGSVIAASAERNTPGSSSSFTRTESESVTFTTKTGSQPFGGGGVSPNFKPGKTVNSGRTNVSSKPYTKEGSTKPISRYTADDFAAWERENYQEEFSKPRGGFGNNI